MTGKYTLILSLAAVALLVVIGTAWAKCGKCPEDKDVALPDVVSKAFREAWPDATFGRTGAYDREGVRYYWAKLTVGERTFKATGSEVGTITGTKWLIGLPDVPEKAAEVIRKGIEGGELKDIYRNEYLAECLRKEDLVTCTKLDTPRIGFWVRYLKDGKELAFGVNEDGTLCELPKDKGHKHGGDKHS
jgi:hypothetical protein